MDRFLGGEVVRTMKQFHLRDLLDADSMLVIPKTVAQFQVFAFVNSRPDRPTIELKVITILPCPRCIRNQDKLDGDQQELEFE